MISWISDLLQKRGKWIFSVLLAIIIVAFVFTIGAGPGIVRNENRSYHRDFYGIDLNNSMQIRILQNATMVSRYLDGVQRFNDSQIQQQMLMRQARLFLTEALAIPTPTEAQLAEYIKGKRAFQNPQGNFEKARLTNFVSNLQTDELVNQEFLMQVLRENYRLEQLDDLLTAPGFVFEAEIEAMVAREKTKWSVEVAKLDYNTFEPEIDVADEAVQEFFTSNAAAYRIPDIYSMTYLEFDASTVKDTVEDPGDETLQHFFLTNRNLFTESEKTLMPTDEDAVAPTPLEIFQKIRGKVFIEYANAQKAQQAVMVANEFIGTLFDNSVAYKSEEFNTMLTDHGVALRLLTSFTRNPATQSTDIVPAKLFEEAFRLDDDRYFSDVVANADNTKFLVGFLESKTPSRAPELDEVKDRVVADFKESKKQEAFAAKGIELKAALSAEGASFATVSEANAMTVESFEDFSLIEKPEALQYQLLQPIEALKVGESSDMITVDATGYFVTVTAKNTPETAADDARYAAVSSSLEGYSGYARYQAILDQLLALKLDQPAQN